MAKFPENTSVPMKNPLSEEITFKTLISSFDDQGEEKRKQKNLYPKRNSTIAYEWISKAEARTLWQFYLDRKGSYEAFNLFLLFQNIYQDEYVGTGDGSSTVFNLPAKNSSDYTVFKNGVEQEGGGTDYTFGSGTGADGADRITFTVAPAAGDRITYDFTGNLKVRSRFLEDNLSFETFYDRLANMGIKLKGLLNA